VLRLRPMKPALLAAALAACFASPAWAQPKEDPQVAECRARTKRAHDDLVAVYRKGAAQKKIDDSERAAFDAKRKGKGKLKAQMDMLSKDGLTLQGCRMIGSEIARERKLADDLLARPAKKK
jgi:hypothetical protein